MVKVNAHNNENNGSYPVLWQFFLKIWNFCVVDQKSVADVGLIDSFNVNPLKSTFSMRAQSKHVFYNLWGWWLDKNSAQMCQ